MPNTLKFWIKICQISHVSFSKSYAMVSILAHNVTPHA